VARLSIWFQVGARLRKGAEARVAPLACDPVSDPQGPEAVRSREGALAWAIRASGLDSRFKSLIKLGDEARDGGDFDLGVSAYRRALKLYPDHQAYHVQLGHCLKEARRFEEAEVGYRDAIALGAPLDDVMEHLSFVMERSGSTQRAYPADILDILTGRLRIDRYRLVTSRDCLALGELFFGETLPASWVVRALRAAPTVGEAVAFLVSDPAFQSRNRRLLALASSIYA
jgi:tetratricopeptide (TPR) repeat protein